MATALGLGIGLPTLDPVWEARVVPPDPPGGIFFDSTIVFFDDTTITFDSDG